MMIEFQIAGEAETERLILLLREFAEEEGKRWNDGQKRRALAELFSCPDFNLIWLILEGDAAIGYIILTLGHSIEYGGRDAFIDEVYVRSSHRGRGIGARAIEVAEAAALKLSVNAMHLEFDRDNAPALGLYRNFGFEGHESLFMTRWLDSERTGAASTPFPESGIGGTTKGLRG